MRRVPAASVTRKKSTRDLSVPGIPSTSRSRVYPRQAHARAQAQQSSCGSVRPLQSPARHVSCTAIGSGASALNLRRADPGGMSVMNEVACAALNVRPSASFLRRGRARIVAVKYSQIQSCAILRFAGLPRDRVVHRDSFLSLRHRPSTAEYTDDNLEEQP